ncbi:pilus assembly FimT family protein [Thalassotalea montiporae]
MRKMHNSVKGFTLIELIVVISIMAIALSLVGPLTIEFIAKAQAQSELVSLKNSLKKISFKAFSTATEHQVLFNNNVLSLYTREQLVDSKTFEHLHFDKQAIKFNGRGYPFPEVLNLDKLNKQESINLFRLVEGTEFEASK